MLKILTPNQSHHTVDSKFFTVYNLSFYVISRSSVIIISHELNIIFYWIHLSCSSLCVFVSLFVLSFSTFLQLCDVKIFDRNFHDLTWLKKKKQNNNVYSVQRRSIWMCCALLYSKRATMWWCKWLLQWSRWTQLRILQYELFIWLSISSILFNQLVIFFIIKKLRSYIKSSIDNNGFIFLSFDNSK